ncbi:hypothetical protein H112_04506 [Trichophyton rubrum D6]|nr:uncharacterized protein TERG_04278 [Trichophyton rubrum CBS 118892]EZF22647.1 hypothetical protein H100_04513 [Trichophyton rubrum MR850]EZF41691.1 hypothetical protein H102_04500 [Trichophyton rubrum CBS 100081]EZF52386.1 hypothetical protein H103_04509 [Trichophyton rubrum CBS 288.86]EZF62947.1 hypothetical protein H104_04496 [Trichophyton rubrum CBS 289.86]EZF73443.1 hypothetical protein H105_04522 [Trichophyton soudanense CBS 452.61]EZF94978.1 hypothetical protein H113_04538 [Trichophy
MFRRKRSVRHAPLNTNPSPSAQTAALQAFRASQNPNPSLSSSAAAAALRSHTPPPTPVRDVQTKRMLRRKRSASSISVPPGNTLPDGKNGGLRRVRSSGSMTARTFREQSPARGGSATSNLADMIPVPPLPRGYAASPPQRPRNADLPGVQGTASANGASSAAAIAGRRARSVSNLSLGPADLERGGSRNSINFSYPMNRPNSPRLSIASLDSPRRDGLGSPRLHQHQQQKVSTEQASVQSTDKPVTGKPPPLSESRPMLVDQATQVADDSFNPMPTSPPGTQQTDNKPVVNDIVAKPSPTVTGGTQTDSHDEIRHASPPPILGRRPSTVLELQEETEDDQPTKRHVIHQSLDFTKQRPMETIRLKEPPPVQHIKPRAKPQQQSQPQDASALPAPNIFHIRPSSISPNRLTRFSEHLEIPDSENNLHNPPPRSLSPAKPALKSTPSPSLGARPERSTYQPGQPGSETSEGTSLVSDDGSRAGSKKRHPKVSFEDETEVIGHGISPPTSPESLTSQSPRAHTPRSWSDSIIQSKFGDDDSNDFEQFFTPRPALPSFGSIRGRKPSRSQDVEDDSNPALEISSSSADHAIGGILSTAGGRDQSKHDANANLQLPPEVTSLESTGYSSLSDDTSSDEGPELQYLPAHLDSKKDDTPASKDTPSQANGTSQPRQIKAENHLKPTPAIFIQPATPGMEEVTHSKRPSSEIPNNEHTQGVYSYFSANDKKPLARKEEDDDSNSDSGNSVYSDAYEDLSDMEGDGFGSIDAIVDRSVPSMPEPQQPSVTHSQPQESGQRDEPNGTAEAYAVANATPETQSQPARQHQPEGTAEERESCRQALSTANSAKTAERPLFEEKMTSPPAAPSYPSPRIGSSGQFNHHSPALRPILESNGSSEKKSVKAKGKAPLAVRPQRTMSNASDSSSSFKRPKRFRSTGRYTLRRTMRTTSADHGMEVLSDGGLPPTKTIDHSLNHRPFSSNDSRPMMRTTLRQSPSTTTSRFSVLTGRGKSTKANGSSAKHQPFKSRYEDSSDEEGGAIKLRPVRGIPRRRNETEGDSTDLDDSSEDEATRHVLRRKKSNKGDSRAIQDPAVAAAVARLMAPRDIEQSAAISVIPGPEQLPEFNIKHRSGLLGRLHLPKNNKLRRESILRKPDITLEQPRLGLDQASIPSPGLPQEDYTITTTVNGRVLERSRSDWQPLSPKLQKRASKLIHRSAGDSWPLRSNGHTAFSLPSSPSTTERRRPTVLPMQEITNGKDSDTRPRTADSVAAQNTTQHTTTASVPNSPMSPARAERSLWASRFRPSRRGTDDNSTASAVSEVHLSSLRNEIPRHEKKSRFPKLKKVFGIS